MRKITLILLVSFFAAGAFSGCSTTAKFKIPADSRLVVTDRTVTPDANGNWETSPFFWSEAGGARYSLYDKNGEIIRSGKLKTNFRIVSIFWPPFALIYWPMGLTKNQEYDLTRRGDGYFIKDETMPSKNEKTTENK